LISCAGNCGVLETEEHVIVKIAESEELVHIFRVGGQDPTANNGGYGNENGRGSRGGLQMDKVEITIQAARGSSPPCEWLHKCEFKRSI